MKDLQEALGQYLTYLAFLEQTKTRRKLYIAISDIAYSLIEDSAALQMVLRKYQVPVIVVDLETEEVTQWIQN